jgi:glycosyltransferase involved in cell wall biosynthesis
MAAGKRVQFLHDLDDPAVVDQLQRAMALVHPTPVDATGDARAHELFGLAIVEAMAAGCPVIASAVASLPEIVVDGASGFLVPPNDSSAIGRAIERLRSNTELWSQLSLGARRRAELFSWPRVAEACLRAYVDPSDKSALLDRKESSR